jgi:hypothetical protein
MSTNIPTIFISHVSEEKELALILKRHLAADFAGRVKVFVSSDMESILTGDDWLESVKRALDEASLELILCSRISISRPWVNFEAGAAWLKKIPIVPVCHSSFPACDLPIPFSVLHAAEAGQEDGLRLIYYRIATTLKVDVPEADFKGIAKEVRDFEARYMPGARVHGHGAIDLRQGERVVGSWKGTGHDLEVPGEIEYKTKLSYELTLELRQQHHTIAGEFHFHTFERDRRDTAFIELINISGEYFYFKYWVAIQQANQCGFMVLELSRLGDELEGVFLTNKVFERQIGFGKLLWRRQ